MTPIRNNDNSNILRHLYPNFYALCIEQNAIYVITFDKFNRSEEDQIDPEHDKLLPTIRFGRSRLVIDSIMIESNRLNQTKILESKKNRFTFGLIDSRIIPESNAS